MDVSYATVRPVSQDQYASYGRDTGQPAAQPLIYTTGNDGQQHVFSDRKDADAFTWQQYQQAHPDAQEQGHVDNGWDAFKRGFSDTVKNPLGQTVAQIAKAAGSSPQTQQALYDAGGNPLGFIAGETAAAAGASQQTQDKLQKGGEVAESLVPGWGQARYYGKLTANAVDGKAPSAEDVLNVSQDVKGFTTPHTSTTAAHGESVQPAALPKKAQQPSFNPPQRLPDGRIGYPLGPTRPPKLPDTSPDANRAGPSRKRPADATADPASPAKRPAAASDDTHAESGAGLSQPPYRASSPASSGLSSPSSTRDSDASRSSDWSDSRSDSGSSYSDSDSASDAGFASFAPASRSDPAGEARIDDPNRPSYRDIMSIGGEPYDASQRERLTQRYRPQQLNADAFGNPVVHVSDQTWENLANAQRIIDRLREWMPYGAGNQHWDIQHTQGESIKRQELGRKDGYSCLQTGAGNCSEFADIGTKLAGSEIRNQPVMTAKAQGLDHMVTLIGDHREVGKDNVTVQDAWPSYATAYTWGQGVVNEYEPRGASRHEDFNPGEYQKPMSSQLVDDLFAKKIDPDFSLADEYQYFPDKIYTQRTFGGDMSTRYVSDAHPEGRVFDSIPSYYVRKYDDYIKQNDDFGGPLFARRNPMR